MTQIILDKAILQEVKEGFDEWDIFEIDGKLYLNGYNNETSEMLAGLKPLPSGQYEILGLGSELTIEQKMDLVKQQKGGGKYFDYGIEGTSLGKYGCYILSNPAASFASLLRSHNLQPETTLVILKK